MPSEAGFEVLSWLDPISLAPFPGAEEREDGHLENFEETSFFPLRLGTIATTGGKFSPDRRVLSRLSVRVGLCFAGF